MHFNFTCRHESEGIRQAGLGHIGPSNKIHQGVKYLATDPECQRQQYIELVY